MSPNEIKYCIGINFHHADLKLSGIVEAGKATRICFYEQQRKQTKTAMQELFLQITSHNHARINCSYESEM